MKHTATKAEKVEKAERAEQVREEKAEKAEKAEQELDRLYAEEAKEVKSDEELPQMASLPASHTSVTLSSIRALISSRDDNSRARIYSKASQIREIALSDEEGRLALYLVHAEGSV